MNNTANTGLLLEGALWPCPSVICRIYLLLLLVVMVLVLPLLM